MKQEHILSLASNTLAVPVMRDGKRVGVLTLHPDDTAFLTKFYALLQTLEQQRATLAAKLDTNTTPQHVLETLQEACCCLRTEIDTVFGVGTSAFVFGEGCSLTLLQQFFEGVSVALRDARSAKLAAYTAPSTGAVLS